jgi:hypothetical protein
MKQINMKQLLLLCLIFASTTKMLAESNKTQANPLLNQAEMNNSIETPIESDLAAKIISSSEIIVDQIYKIWQIFKSGFSTFGEFFIWLLSIYFFEFTITILVILVILIIILGAANPLILAIIGILITLLLIARNSPSIKPEEIFRFHEQVFNPSEEGTTTANQWKLTPLKNTADNNPLENE